MKPYSSGVISFCGSVRSLGEEYDWIHTNLVYRGQLINGQVLRSQASRISDLWMTKWVREWLTDWLTDWLTGIQWLTDWLNHIASWLTGWLTDHEWMWDWLIEKLIYRQTDCLTDWEPKRLSGSLNDWLTDWLTDWLAERVGPTDRLTDWQASTQTLFYFSLRSFRKHRRAREKEKYRTSIFFSPTPTPLRWRSINPPRFLFFITHAQQTLKKKRGSVNGLLTDWLRDLQTDQPTEWLSSMVFDPARELSSMAWT